MKFCNKFIKYNLGSLFYVHLSKQNKKKKVAFLRLKGNFRQEPQVSSTENDQEDIEIHFLSSELANSSKQTCIQQTHCGPETSLSFLKIDLTDILIFHWPL